MLKDLGLRITTVPYAKVINFLDVTLYLTSQTYRPYTKPNNTIYYVNKLSNHPPTIIKAIPESINRRLSSILSNENEFNSASREFQQALNKAGYQHELRYTKEKSQKKRNRKRNITWYNPPYSKHVATKVGKRFLQLLDKHFPKGNPLHKIFNRNNVKVSYSCMDNMAKIISSHNKSILSKADRTTKDCNCRTPTNCPLEGKCQTKNIVYQATVTSQRGSYIYIGACDTEFKKRWYNHKSSFKLEHKRTDTELSKHIWTLRESNMDFNLNWKILKQATSYSNTSKRCQLCLWEKFFIITEKSPILNSRTELISKCRHSNKYLLSSI